MPALATLSDDFNDNSFDTVKWPNSFGTVTETGGVCHIDSSSAWAAIESARTYTLTGSAVFAKITPAPAAGGTQVETEFIVVSNANRSAGTYARIVIDTALSTIIFQNWVAFSDAGQVSLTYSATDHAWLRIREAAGTLYFETAPDGVTWTTRKSVATPAWAANTDISFMVEAHRATGTAQVTDVDNVNVSGAAPQTIAVGTAAEADAAQPMAPLAPQTIAVGTAAETDAAQPVTASLTQPPPVAVVGTATETDTASSISGMFPAPPTWPDKLTVSVAAAWGAEPAADPATWTWTELTGDLLADPIKITYGRADEASETQPAQATFTLISDDGRYLPDNPLSPLYPNVRLGTPIRIRITLPAAAGGGTSDRFFGHLTELTPSWPAGDTNAPTPPHTRVELTAAGTLRRITQGKKALRSALFRQVTAHSEVVAYWPCEDGEDVGAAVPRKFSSPLPSVRPTALHGEIDLASVDGPGGSDKLPMIRAGSRFYCPVPAHTLVTNSWAVDFCWRMETAPPADTVVADITATGTGATISWWRIWCNATTVGFIGWDDQFNQIISLATTAGQLDAASYYGHWLRFHFYVDPTLCWLTVYQIGGDNPPRLVDLADNPGDTPTQVTTIGVDTVNADRAMGHITLTTPGGLGDTHDPFLGNADGGHYGETAAARIARLCSEENIQITVIGAASESTRLGPQRPGELITLLRAAEAADDGILAESRTGPGLIYRTRASLYNQAPAMTLNAASLLGDITHPFTPTLDDQRIRNDVTVEREGGAARRVTDPAHIAAHGSYDEQLTLTLADDYEPYYQAGWRLSRGTWPGMRYPQLSPALGADVTLLGPWAGVRLGDRITVTGLPRQHAPEAIDVLTQGWEETITLRTWDVTINTAPAGPYIVAVFDDVDARFGPTTATLTNAVTAAATSISITSTGQRFATSGIFPFLISFGGETARVTAITGTGATQTFTVVRAINGVSKPHPAGEAVEITPTSRYAL